MYTRNMNQSREGLSSLTIILLIALGIGGFLLYKNQVILPKLNSPSFNTPTPNSTKTYGNSISSYTSNLKTQKIGEFTFKCPADWKGGVEGNYSAVPLTSPDIKFANPGGILEQGMRAFASVEGFQQTYVGSSTFKSLDQMETYIRNSVSDHAALYKEVHRTQISGLDALRYVQEGRTQRGPYFKSKSLFVVHKDKVYELTCDFNPVALPKDADSICENIINSMTLNSSN